VLLLLMAAPGPKNKAALGMAYCACQEVPNLKMPDIDRARMVLRVEQGKGKKDRNGMLSPRLLQLPREWRCVGQPTMWCFRGTMLPITIANSIGSFATRQRRSGLRTACRRTLGDSFVPDFLEQGVDMRVIQVV
jgi:site-specific recombinase XerD